MISTLSTTCASNEAMHFVLLFFFILLLLLYFAYLMHQFTRLKLNSWLLFFYSLQSPPTIYIRNTQTQIHFMKSNRIGTALNRGRVDNLQCNVHKMIWWQQVLTVISWLHFIFLFFLKSYTSKQLMWNVSGSVHIEKNRNWRFFGIWNEFGFHSRRPGEKCQAGTLQENLRVWISLVRRHFIMNVITVLFDATWHQMFNLVVVYILLNWESWAFWSTPDWIIETLCNLRNVLYSILNVKML